MVACAGHRAEVSSLSSHFKSHPSCLRPVVFWGYLCPPERWPHYLSNPHFNVQFLVHWRMLMRRSDKRRPMKENIVLLIYLFFLLVELASRPSPPTATPTVNSSTRNRLNNLSPILNIPNCCCTNPSIFGSQTSYVTTGGERKKNPD